MLTVDDAIAAAEIIREADAGRYGAAEDLIIAAGLGALTDEQMRGLCDLHGVEI
jgi:hypothetical protein